MTGAAAAVAAGLLITGGLLALVLGLRRTEPRPPPARPESAADLWARLTRRPPGVRGRRRDLILLGSLVAGFVVAALTGWVIALVIAPLLALGLPYLLVVPKPRDVELMEALDRWVRSLAATLGHRQVGHRRHPGLPADRTAADRRRDRHPGHPAQQPLGDRRRACAGSPTTSTPPTPTGWWPP